jgi:calmodulin
MRQNQFDLITKDELVKMFAAFDQDSSGKLLAEDIKQVMTSGGEKLTNQQADEILDDFRLADGYIDYERFAEKLLAK